MPVTVALLASPSAAVAAPPPNDDVANAVVWTGETSFVGTNVDATKETGEPNHAGNPGGASIWYQGIPPINGTATISTCGSDFDTVLAVYSASGPVPPFTNLTPVASNDDSCGVQSSVTFDATAGTTYYVAVDGLSGATGNVLLSLTVTFPSPPPPDPPGVGGPEPGVGGPGPGVGGLGGTFKGVTAQGRDATVWVGDDGLVNKVKIKARVRCQPGGPITGRSVFKAPLDESTPTSFADKLSVEDKRGGIRLRSKEEVAAEKISDTEWTGTYEVKLRISGHGRLLARCKLREISWSATSV